MSRLRGPLHLAILLAAIAAGTLAATPRWTPDLEIPAASDPDRHPGVDPEASRDLGQTSIGAPSANPSERPIGPVAVTTAGPRPQESPSSAVRTNAPSIAPTTHPESPAPSARSSNARVAQRQRQRSEGPSSPSSNLGPSTILTGYASWYGTGGPGLYAALHDFVDGTRVQVAVCAYPNGQASCVTVPVVTQCGACRWRAGATVVDLSVPAFLALGVPLSVGLVKVTVEVLS